VAMTRGGKVPRETERVGRLKRKRKESGKVGQSYDGRTADEGKEPSLEEKRSRRVGGVGGRVEVGGVWIVDGTGCTALGAFAALHLHRTV
jgi:hypothetical protein